MKTCFYVVNGTEQTTDCIGGVRPRKYVYKLEKDAFPTEGVHNGDVAYEMDTGKSFLYDAEGKKWWPV